MVILDPDRDGCTVWLIHSPIIGYESKVTHIKGTTFEVCKSLVNRLTGYKEIKNQCGNYVKKLCWADSVYLDIAAFGRDYKYIFKDYGLDVIDVRAKSADTIIPEGNAYNKSSLSEVLENRRLRDATPEEQKSIQEYIDKISEPTGVNFLDPIKELDEDFIEEKIGEYKYVLSFMKEKGLV